MFGRKRGLKLTFTLKIIKKGGLKSIFFAGTLKSRFFSSVLKKGGLKRGAYPSPSHNEYPPPPPPPPPPGISPLWVSYGMSCEFRDQFMFRLHWLASRWCCGVCDIILVGHALIRTDWLKIEPWDRLNKKDNLTRYGNSHVKDKTS